MVSIRMTIAISIACAAASAGCAGNYVPETCGTDPDDPAKILLTGVTELQAWPAPAAGECPDGPPDGTPMSLDVEAGEKAAICIVGKGTKSDEKSPILCGAVMDNLIPLNIAIGGPNDVDREKTTFGLRMVGLVECTPAGYLRRLDNGRDFEKETDVTVSLLVPKNPDPRVGKSPSQPAPPTASNPIHVRCLDGDDALKNQDLSLPGDCSVSGEGRSTWGPLVLLPALLLRRRARAAITSVRRPAG